MSSVAARLRGRDPKALDIALAGALVLGCAVEVAVYADGVARELVFGAIGAASLAAMALRRTRPLLVTAVVCVATAVASFGASFYLERLTVPYFAAMILIYTLGRYVSGRRGIAAASIVLAVVTVFSAIAQDEVFEATELVWLLVVGLGPFLVGRVLGDRARLQAEIRDRTRDLERDAELRAERAAEEERIRLAAELQAVIANGVSAMVVQAEAVPRVLKAGQPDRAAGALALIEETGRDSLAEMRRLLGVLRRAGDGPALAPQPGLGELEGLIEGATQDGLEVELRVEGDCLDLGPGLDLTAYRIVQQALATALARGASRASVEIACDDQELRLEIRDDGREPDSEQAALTAARERLGLYGGRLAAGPDGARGFRIQARMPLEKAAR
jgi:signal transduction histidine kinase